MHTRFLFYLIIAFFLAACQGASAEISASPTGLPVHTPEPATATPLIPTRTLVSPTLTITTTPTLEQTSREWKLWNEGPHHASPTGFACETCHGANLGKVENGQMYCQNCHKDAAASFSPTLAAHQVHASLTCLNCHNPHSAEVNCTNSGCHENLPKNKNIAIATPEDGHPFQASGDSLCGGAVCHPSATQEALDNPTIHGTTHSPVSCIACHDASGALVAYSPETGKWFIEQSLPGTAQTPVAAYSHIVTTEVSCTRCHFKENPWRLPLVTGNEYKK